MLTVHKTLLTSRILHKLAEEPGVREEQVVKEAEVS